MAKRRGCLRLILALAALVVLFAALAPLLPLNFLRPQVESGLSAALGRNVTVGAIKLRLLGGPRLTINGVTAKEDAAFGTGDFLKADEVSLDFALGEYLLHRRIVIHALAMTSPIITFSKNAGGAWSWTTIGQASGQTRRGGRLSLLFLLNARSLVPLGLSASTGQARLDNVRIDNATIKLTDATGSQPSKTTYRNISLRAAITHDSTGASRAIGELAAKSDGDDRTEALKTTLPFDLTIDATRAAEIVVKGALGPGPLETRNFSAQSFKITAEISSRVAASRGRDSSAREGADRPGAGSEAGSVNATGHISSSQIVIPAINLSEHVAHALRISRIGNMNPGTEIGSLETDFRTDQDVVRTPGLSLQQLDGLGDASASDGWFKLGSSLTLNYSATVLLSNDATGQAKGANPMIGAAITILEQNNRVSLPIQVTGDLHNPQVQVDVFRIFR